MDHNQIGLEVCTDMHMHTASNGPLSEWKEIPEARVTISDIAFRALLNATRANMAGRRCTDYGNKVAYLVAMNDDEETALVAYRYDFTYYLATYTQK